MRRTLATVLTGLLAVAGTLAWRADDAVASTPASQLIVATRRGVAPFRDPIAAERAGYAPVSVSGPIEHWVDQRLFGGGRLLDPEHPEGLVYVDTGRGLRLVAAMFILHRAGQVAPEVTGATWHHHSWCQGVGGIGVPLPGGPCPPGTSRQVGPEMLHVWMSDVALDPFAAAMTPAVVCRLATNALPSGT